VILLVIFGFISRNVPGNVSGSGLTVIDLYIPTIMVISFVGIAISLPNTLVRDREIGWLRRISTTPVHPSRLLGAQLILDLVLAAAGNRLRHWLAARRSSVRHSPSVHPVLHPLHRTRRSPRSSRWAWSSSPWLRRRPRPAPLPAGCSSSP
jgi:hypothetical protein